MSPIIAYSSSTIQSLINKGNKSASKEEWKALDVDPDLYLLFEINILLLK